MTGMVYLIGAGPGDVKLITVKGRECIEKADVIVYDYLADAHLLEWARPDAELIYAGKQCKDHTMHQWEINELLVQKGKEGKIVARLKGGDPLVFGRGGEEAMALGEAGVPFEFVPGVTSPIAAPAYVGIPVTQRAMATSFAVVTGHEDPTKAVSGIHWEGLATAVDTLCFVMGVGNLPTIAEKLIAHGRPASTPVALVRWGTKTVQEVLVSTLEHVVEDVEKAQLKAPAIIVVGDVVNLREKLQWFDNKPLFGKTIVVTRARSQASAFREKLADQGANVVEAAAIKTSPLELFDEDRRIINNTKQYQCIVFTSGEGVRYFFDALYKEGKDTRALGNSKVAAIGCATARELQKYGIVPDIIPVDYKAESAVKALEEELKAGDSVLLIQPKVARDVIPRSLRHHDIDVDILRLYETTQDTSQQEALVNALTAGTVDYITFTSSSTVTNTIQLLGDDALKLLGNTKIACIGPITAATAMSAGLKPAVISDVYTTDGLVNAIVKDI